MPQNYPCGQLLRTLHAPIFVTDLPPRSAPFPTSRCRCATKRAVIAVKKAAPSTARKAASSGPQKKKAMSHRFHDPLHCRTISSNCRPGILQPTVPLSPLESILAKWQASNLVRINTYEKRGGGVSSAKETGPWQNPLPSRSRKSFAICSYEKRVGGVPTHPFAFGSAG